jgi:hypothetical protein
MDLTAVAFEDGLGRMHLRVPQPRFGFAGFRFLPDVDASDPMEQGLMSVQARRMVGCLPPAGKNFGGPGVCG